MDFVDLAGMENVILWLNNRNICWEKCYREKSFLNVFISEISGDQFGNNLHLSLPWWNILTIWYNNNIKRIRMFCYYMLYGSSNIIHPHKKVCSIKASLWKIISHLSECINGLIQFPFDEKFESVRRLVEGGGCPRPGSQLWPWEAESCDWSRPVTSRPLLDGRPLE